MAHIFYEPIGIKKINESDDDSGINVGYLKSKINISKYTYIVDSNEKLDAWASNAPGNDYSKVLVKSGTWTTDKTINLTTTGNIFIEGEEGNLIKSSAFLVIKRDIDPEDEDHLYELNIRDVVISDKKYYIDGINIESILNWDGTLGEDYWDYGPVKGFEYCANLYNCTYNNVSTGIWVDEYETYDAFTYIGFYGCFNLVNCFGKHKGNYSYSGMNSIFEFCEKFDTCEGVANDGTNVFTSCVNLNNCKGWCGHIKLLFYTNYYA